MTRVMVVDDHEVVRFGICHLLNQLDGVTVVGEACSGEESLLKAREIQPDVIFMDVRMPGIGGLEATQRLRVSQPQIRIIVLSALSDDTMPSRLLKAGASGYLTKNAGPPEVQKALATVLDGGIYISPEIAQQLLVRSFGDGESPVSELSERELQIAVMLASGLKVGDIAITLNISPKTIATHKYRVFEKLGVTNDVQLALRAVKWGLVDLDEVL